MFFNQGSSRVRSRHQPDEPGPEQVGSLQDSSCRSVGRGGNSHSGTFLRPTKKNRNNSYSAAVNHALKRKYSTAPATATSESIPECSRTAYADSRDNRERSPKVLNARTHFQRNSAFDEECERVHVQAKQSLPRTCENLRGRSMINLQECRIDTFIEDRRPVVRGVIGIGVSLTMGILTFPLSLQA